VGEGGLTMKVLNKDWVYFKGGCSLWGEKRSGGMTMRKVERGKRAPEGGETVLELFILSWKNVWGGSASVACQGETWRVRDI